MFPAELPVARALFAQWRRARGDRSEQRTRPFTRGWEALLEDAGILSGIDREEALRDAQVLEAGGWVELKTVRYRPSQLERIGIPLEAETRWMEAFGFVPATDEETERIRAFAWEAELAFLREARVSMPFDDLRRLNEFLASGGQARPLVPIKERSLQIFGDEKRLDALLDSSLFAPDRLNPASLRFILAHEPLAWQRGPVEAAAGPVLVLENAATWHSYTRWNQIRPQFSTTIYGAGNRFIDGIPFLAEIFRELGGVRRILYFGDLDPQGLRIPQIASVCGRAAGLPDVEPHLWSYEQLLALGAGHEQPCDDDSDQSELARLTEWLADQAAPALALLSSRRRLAQERLGWEWLAAVVQTAS